MDDTLEAVAERIRSADALFVFSGAGMGVDSGLATYRGKHAGNFGLDYEDICDDRWFDLDPSLAWGFWARCQQAYARARPHAGYTMIRTWGESRPQGHFVLTSNVDGHWIRSGGATDRVVEVHGSIRHLQPCTSNGAAAPDADAVWLADPQVMDAMRLTPWELRPGQHVHVQLAHAGVWSEATVSDDGKHLVAEGRAVRVFGLRTEPDGPDLLRLVDGSQLPCCPADGAPARPNILMFHDRGFNSARADSQERLYNAWLGSLPKGARVVVLEVGVGTAVPKIRAKAELAAQSFEHSTLVRINLDDMEHVCVGTDEIEERVLYIRMGALAALREIDRRMREASSSSRVADAVDHLFNRQ